MVDQQELIPLRALNQVTYCSRLYYLEYVESIMPINEHVEDGLFQHRRVDSPELQHRPRRDGEVVHTRSIQLASAALGLTGKLDLVEEKDGRVRPVEYKRGPGPSGDKRQQACGGGSAEGRMPYVTMIFNPVPDLPANHAHRPPSAATMQARYLAGLYDLNELGELLRRQAGQVGMSRAEHWIGLSDGGNGLENFLRKNFPGPIGGSEITIILDFWHASDSLCKLAKALHPADDIARQELLTSWCHIMKHEGGLRMRQVLPITVVLDWHEQRRLWQDLKSSAPTGAASP